MAKSSCQVAVSFQRGIKQHKPILFMNTLIFFLLIFYMKNLLNYYIRMQNDGLNGILNSYQLYLWFLRQTFFIYILVFDRFSLKCTVGSIKQREVRTAAVQRVMDLQWQFSAYFLILNRGTGSCDFFLAVLTAVTVVLRLKLDHTRGSELQFINTAGYLHLWNIIISSFSLTL